jgi:PAS domain-containing protein
MVWYKDTQNRILRANRQAAASINKTVAEVEGKSTYDLYPEEAEKYHQDDLAVVASGDPKLGIVELY